MLNIVTIYFIAWWQKRNWWERMPTTKSWKEATKYPWWWQPATTESPTETWWETKTTESSRRHWLKADWWKSIIKPKHIKKAVGLFRNFDIDK